MVKNLAAFIGRQDRFTIGLLLSVLAGCLYPASGGMASFLGDLKDWAIMLLFFLYGAKLSRQAVWKGISHWRLQGIILAFTFVLFPLLGLVFRPILEPWMGESLYMGMLYVCVLPSTVQSSIAFTSIAGGNVPAAVCAASLSSLLGVFLTPLLVSYLVFNVADSSPPLGSDVFLQICYLILFPFLLGQILQRWVGLWVQRSKTLISWTDQSTIWLVVYISFSSAMLSGVWSLVSPFSFFAVVLVSLLFLGLVLFSTNAISKWCGFSREDRIAIVFCGSKKSLATGIPMMGVLFVGLNMGVMVIPLMVFHQLQLMACAALARHWRIHS